MARLLLLLGSLLFAIGLAEAAVRIFAIGPHISPVYRETYRLSANPVLRYELAPRTRFGEHAINSRGMRDREYPLAKSPGSFRIAVVGDSIAFGHEVGQSEAFAKVLEGLLNARAGAPGVAYEVLNFGVTGYGIEQIVETARTQALSFDPDLLVYAYCLNDPLRFSLEMENLLAQTTAAERGYLQRAVGTKLRLYVLLRYLAESQTRKGQERGRERTWRDDAQFAAIDGGRYGAYYGSLHAPGEPWDRVQTGFDTLATLSQENTLPVLVVVFPVFRALEDDSLEGVHRRLAAALDARSLGHLDLGEVYRAFPPRPRSQLVYDPLHPSSRGHRVAALAILWTLLDRGWLGEASLERFEALTQGNNVTALYARAVDGHFGRRGPSPEAP